MAKKLFFYAGTILLDPSRSYYTCEKHRELKKNQQGTCTHDKCKNPQLWGYQVTRAGIEPATLRLRVPEFNVYPLYLYL